MEFSPLYSDKSLEQTIVLLLYRRFFGKARNQLYKKGRGNYGRIHKKAGIKNVYHVFLCKSLQNFCKKLQTGQNPLTVFGNRGIKKP